VDTSDMGHDAFHSEVKQNRGKIRNKEEAKAIMTILKRIAEDDALINYLNSVRKTDAAIGVICMYAEQKRYLQQLFNQNAWPEGFKDLVNIDTVDSYQGKENRIIIVSITRSDKSNTPGFMIMPNRINVALSRAMDRLIVVGNKNVWTGRNRDLPFGKVVKHMEEKGIDEGYRFVFSKTLKGEMV
jgi:superfamily I DNA and/or RNA helicase